MADIEYKHIDWDDLNRESLGQKEARKAERIGWFFAAIFLVTLVAFFIPYKDLLMSEEELQKHYARSYAWLNRCDHQCAEKVNLNFLDLQTKCDGLKNLFTENRNNNLLEWRLAIDDRASSLGCPEFPKSMAEIQESVQAAEEQRQRQLEAEQQRITERLEREKKERPERFERSLAEGKLDHFVHDLAQDEDDPGTMTIYVNSQWFAQKQRKQIAQVVWQKWANIYSPARPDKARISIVTHNGEVVGGSPPGAAQPIWIKGE